MNTVLSYLAAVERGNKNMETVEIWRTTNGDTEIRIVPCQPFIFCSKTSNPWARNLSYAHELEGGKELDLRLDFSTWTDFYNAKDLVKGKSLVYSNTAKQHLVKTRQRMFEGLGFNQITRLTFDIETGGLEASKSPIFMIGAIVNEEYHAFYIGGNDPDGNEITSEAGIIKAFSKLIYYTDPDILEGHNIFMFDLPFIAERAARFNIPLTWGRNGKPMQQGNIRTAKIGPNDRTIVPHYIWGRHVLDTYIGVQRYDVPYGRLHNFGLKSVAEALGIAAEDRVIVDREEMETSWETNPEEVLLYARQDVEECRRLSEIVHIGEFFQCQMVPDGLGNLALSGTGEKINAMLVAAYMDAGEYSIPIPNLITHYQGGFVEARQTGKFKQIVKADYESLYPSIMLSRELSPANDYLGKLLPMLEDWKSKRLYHKKLGKDSSLPAETRLLHNGMNEAFKILINSMYGYMGSNFANFNDGEVAAEVTNIGRNLITDTAKFFTNYNCNVIEIDTDGIIFSMNTTTPCTEKQEKDLISLIGSAIESYYGKGFILAHDGRYNQMISLKAKNYILQDYDGKLTIKGASIRNRNHEPIFRAIIDHILAVMFDERYDTAEVIKELTALYWSTAGRISCKEVDKEEMCRRERITYATKVSPLKKRLRAISEHLKMGEFLWVYEMEKQPDKSTPLAPMAHWDHLSPDYNTRYYLEKLRKTFSRFEDLFVGQHYDFNQMFPKWLVKYYKGYMKRMGLDE